MTSPQPAQSPFRLEDKRPGPVAQFFITLIVRRIIPAVFNVLCRFAPVFRFPFTNTVIVTSFDYVQEVCQRQNDFPVPYQRQIDRLGWKPSFLLAMKDTPEYWRTLDQVKELWLTSDLDFVRQIAREASEAALDEAAGDIDAIQDLMVPVTEAVIQRYYGVPIPADQKQSFFDGAMHVAGFLFGSQSLTPKTIKSAQEAISVVWKVIDDAIQAAHENPLPSTTIIGRCHAEKITDDQHLRSYLMGMIMGYLPTNTLANGHALNVILTDKDAYEFGLQAAQRKDYASILQMVREALRISYILPGLWRVSPEAQELGVGTKKRIKIAPNRMIYISYMSAMKDRRRIVDPDRFKPDRSPDVYMIYGYQFHYCVGAAIANVMMEEIFMSLMRREPKAVSKLKFNGNFPWNLHLKYKS